MLKLIEYFIGTAEMKATPENKNKALSYMQKNNVFFKDLYEKDGAAYFTALRKSLKDKTLEIMHQKQYEDITKDAEVKSSDIKKYYKDGKYFLYCEVYVVCNIAK